MHVSEHFHIHVLNLRKIGFLFYCGVFLALMAVVMKMFYCKVFLVIIVSHGSCHVYVCSLMAYSWFLWFLSPTGFIADYSWSFLVCFSDACFIPCLIKI